MCYTDMANMSNERVVVSPWCWCGISNATEHDPMDLNRYLTLQQTINPSFPFYMIKYQRKSCNMIICCTSQEEPFKMKVKLIRQMHFWSLQKPLVEVTAIYFREGKRKQNIHLPFGL